MSFALYLFASLLFQRLSEETNLKFHHVQITVADGNEAK